MVRARFAPRTSAVLYLERKTANAQRPPTILLERSSTRHDKVGPEELSSDLHNGSSTLLPGLGMLRYTA